MKHTVPLKQNHEFRRLYNKGKSGVCPYFVIYWATPSSAIGPAAAFGSCTAPTRGRCSLAMTL